MLIAVIILISVATGIAVFLMKFSDLDARKGDIVSAINKKINREISYDSGDFSLGLGPTFIFKGIKIKEKHSMETFATIETITFRVAVLPLLWGKVVFKEVVLERPVGMLHRDQSGLFNISDLMEIQEDTQTFEVENITVHRGAVTFTDQRICSPGLTSKLDDIDLKIAYPVRGKRIDLNVSVSIIQEETKGALSMAGELRLSGKDEPLTSSSIDARITVVNLSIERYLPYYEKHVPFQKMAGILNVDSRLKGNPYQFHSEGSVELKGLNVRYPEVFHTDFTPQKVRLDYALKRSPSEIIMDKLNLVVDDVKISGNCTIKDIDKNDPLITAKASSNPITLETFGPFIPYGIMPRSVAGFIETHIKGGLCQIKEGILHGRISQISHLEKNENDNVLYIKAGVDKGLLTFGRGVPVFSDIKGELELRGKDFILHNMTGHFGESPMTLEGRIADWCPGTPSKYPFAMTMVPGQKEISWLLGTGGNNPFAFTGKTTLQITGSGTMDNYILNGRWDLSKASYRYGDIFMKPLSQSNQLAFKARFKKDDVQLESLSYQLSSLIVNATGLYRMKEKRIPSFVAHSTSFHMEDLAANFPLIMRYQPRGHIQLSISGSGMPKSIANFDWRGNITFSDVSLKPAGSSKAISALSGKVRLAKNRCDTSLLVGRLGNSIIKGTVAVVDFKNPSIDVTAASDLLELEDLGLQSPSRAMKLRNFTGKFIFRDGGLQIKALSAHVNNSVLNVTGVMPDLKKTFFDLHVSSPYLDMDDVVLLSTIKSRKKEKSTAEGLTLRATVQCDKGKMLRFPYSKLQTKLTYRQGGLEITAFDMNAFDGSFSGKGHVVFPIGGSTQYQVDFGIDKMSAIQVLKYAGSENVPIEGVVSMQGIMTAEGKTMPDLKKTAQGTATLRMAKGSLHRFTFLSKVFSILNVSQLLRFRLPDLISTGMPYETITGTISCKDGILSTNDLFIKSDSMNMSIVGMANVVREELDLTIGILPLQTVDKVVNRIPVLGWILTSDKKGLITLYFKAHGNWDDPTVRAIPVRSMAKGVLDIFKRLFQLPEKLVTDTGEVIMGR